jgi:V/A-type H+-transporting ATPase subunit I
MAAVRAHADEAVFAVQGWAPQSAVADVHEFARESRLALTTTEPARDESPPTLLKNPERIAGGEGAVTFYITPGYQTWDPTTIVFFSFCLFFAMIFSDAGYALLLGGVVLLSWPKLATSVHGVRFRHLLVALVVAAAVYGVLVGSYFGVEPRAGTFLASLKVLDIHDQAGMMALAVGIGGLHLMLANTITAWRYRRTTRCLGALGWTIIITGGLVFGSAMMFDAKAQWLQQTGKVVTGIGAGCVLLFSSDRPWATKKLGDWFGRLFDGLTALTGLSKVFGDVLSYLRLFALGLASAQLASTFNQLAGATADSIQGLGLFLAVLILILGHGINFLLAIMSGVVHGLRLNCIEFFNWSLTEEGYPFQAFCKKADR